MTAITRLISIVRTAAQVLSVRLTDGGFMVGVDLGKLGEALMDKKPHKEPTDAGNEVIP